MNSTSRCAARREGREESYRREREAREDSYRREREARRQFEEDMRRKWDRISNEWGNFTNDEGGMVEYEGVAAMRDLPEIGGMPIKDIIRLLQVGRKRREYDGLIRCPEAGAVVLVEFKRRLTVGAVQKFLDDQLPAFLRDFPEMVGDGKVYGAVAGATVDDDAQKLAEEKRTLRHSPPREPADRHPERQSAPGGKWTVDRKQWIEDRRQESSSPAPCPLSSVL